MSPHKRAPHQRSHQSYQSPRRTTIEEVRRQMPLSPRSANEGHAGKTGRHQQLSPNTLRVSDPSPHPNPTPSGIARSFAA